MANLSKYSDDELKKIAGISSYSDDELKKIAGITKQQPAEPQPAEPSAPEWAGRNPTWYGVYGAGKSIAETVGNLPSSAWENIKGIANAAVSPIETVKNINKVGFGIQDILGGDKNTKDAQMAQEILTALKGSYGFTPEGFKPEALSESWKKNPVAPLMDVATLFSAGGAGVSKLGKLGELGKLAEVGGSISRAGSLLDPIQAITKGIAKVGAPLVNTAGKVGASALGLMGGVGINAEKTAFKGGEVFKDYLRGKKGFEEVLKETRSAMDKIKEERSIDYTTRLKNLSDMKGDLNTEHIGEAINNTLKNDFRVKEVPTEIKSKFGNIKIPDSFKHDYNSSYFAPYEQNTVKSITHLIETWGDNTPSGLDALKRQLEGFAKTNKGQTQAFAIKAKDIVENTLKEQVPQYSKMMESWRKPSEFLDEIDKTLSTGNQASADTLLRKLKTTMKDDFEFRNSLIKQMSQKTGKDFEGMISGYMMNSLKPRGAIGPTAAMGEIGYGLFSHDPKILAVLAISSPRVQGEILQYMGEAYKGLLKTTGNKQVRQAVGFGEKTAYQVNKINQNKDMEKMIKKIVDNAAKKNITNPFDKLPPK